jgi:flagellar biosynthesis/type III secretory pathway M-ring protein FliF/YscJ
MKRLIITAAALAALLIVIAGAAYGVNRIEDARNTKAAADHSAEVEAVRRQLDAEDKAAAPAPPAKDQAAEPEEETYKEWHDRREQEKVEEKVEELEQRQEDEHEYGIAYERCLERAPQTYGNPYSLCDNQLSSHPGAP